MDLPQPVLQFQSRFKIGSQVFDRKDRRAGTLLAIHIPANPNLSPTTALIHVGDNTVSWIEFENLETA